MLGGVIVDRAYLREVIDPTMRRFKLKHFGREDVILHSVEMGRGGGAYAFLDDERRRTLFYTELNTVLRELDYKVVAYVMRKDAYVEQYGTDAADPYASGLAILIDRFCWELGDELDAGFGCAEKRNPGLDRELMAAWEALRTNGAGTDFAPSRRIEERIVGLELRDKKPNLAGLQLADLVITPIGRHVAGKATKADQVRWTVVESKLRRDRGSYDGAGLVIRP